MGGGEELGTGISMLNEKSNFFIKKKKNNNFIKIFFVIVLKNVLSLIVSCYAIFI